MTAVSYQPIDAREKCVRSARRHFEPPSTNESCTTASRTHGAEARHPFRNILGHRLRFFEGHRFALDEPEYWTQIALRPGIGDFVANAVTAERHEPF